MFLTKNVYNACQNVPENINLEKMEIIITIQRKRTIFDIKEHYGRWRILP